MNNTSEKKGKEISCAEFSKCVEILYLMLDNEASEEQEAFLSHHLDKCVICFEQYKVEKQIRELLKTKCANLPVPKHLAQEIRSRVFQSA